MNAPRGPLVLVAAMSPRRVIGAHGALPWRYAEDLKHFRSVTRGHAVIMGRKTYESIGRPLPDRRNIVVSRRRDFAAPGCDVVSSFEAAIELARETDSAPRVIGGAEIYALALPLATEFYLTEVADDVDGDAYFPAWNESFWHEVERHTSADGALTFRHLMRNDRSA